MILAVEEKKKSQMSGLDSRSSLNVFRCFFNRLFNELIIQLPGSFPLFLTIYAKHLLLLFIERPEEFVFFLSLLSSLRV